jgi:regulatory protein
MGKPAAMKDSSYRTGKRRRPNAGQQALDSALRLLTRRDHTRWELEVKLRYRGLAASDIAKALARMDDLGYLDDARTAVALADHMAGRGYGILRIRYALEQKGVDAAAIEKALGCCGDEAAQVLNARRALKKKRLRLEREADPLKRHQMAYRFLAGRGFPAMVIRRAIGDADDQRRR